MKFLKKIQGLPERKKKIVFWAILVVLCAVSLVWYINSAQQRIKNFQADKFIESLNLKDIEKLQWPEMPNLENIEINVKETTTTQEN